MEFYKNLGQTLRILGATLPMLLAIGCGPSSDQAVKSQNSVYSTAIAKSTGTVVSRKSNAEERKSVEAERLAIAAVDGQFPRPRDPDTQSKLYKVVAVSKDLVLQLDSGPSVRLDGLNCSPQGIEYLSKTLTFEDSRIAYAPFDGNSVAPMSSEVWLVEMAEARSDASISNYSLIAETALTSGWCKPLRAPTNPHYERYEALAKLANRHAL